MTKDSKSTDTALSKAMKNPLVKITKKSDVAGVISDETKKWSQIRFLPSLISLKIH